MEDIGDSHLLRVGVGTLNFRDVTLCKTRQIYRGWEGVLKFRKCWTKGRSRRLKIHAFVGSPSWMVCYLDLICVSHIFYVILTKQCHTRRNLCKKNLFGNSETDKW